MRLVFRRARGVKSLLLAAIGATLIATVLLTGLADYSREVVDAGTRSAINSALPEERSILVQGPTGGSATELDRRDAALRGRYADGFAGLDTRITGAGYAAGRQLAGDVGAAVPDEDGTVFASMVFLDGLADRADLVGGAWPQAGAAPVQVALAEAAATTLGAAVGDRIPITDRFTKRVSDVAVVGIWRPRDATDPYWRLVPGVTEGVAPQSSTYGPFVLSRDDFLSGFSASASAGWLIEPDLAADVSRLAGVRRATATATETLAEQAGLGSSGLVSSRMDQLVDRLQRADLVGRSALVTPMLLVVVLGGYALLLVAMLLTEQRRGETALMRARGAARFQLAGLAAREAALVVLPAVVLAPLLVTEILRFADRAPMFSDAALRLTPRLDALTWLVAGVAAAGCALAMVGPALRRGGTYVAELAGRSRPTRWATAQRASLDLAIVGLAVLGWVQLRQYSSPLAGAPTGGLGIDPLLAATPTLGVLGGAVVALRVLPPLTRYAERYVDRKPWTATMFGMWQAGRRPQAGPVLLLALAVAVSTLAWCLASTSERSLVDQADHRAGADLRLVESSILPPADRPGQVAALPGVDTALPVWREGLRIGTEGEAGDLVAVDAAAASRVVRMRDDLAGGGLLSGLAAARPASPDTELPAGTRRITGEVHTDTPTRTSAVFAVPGGGYRELPLGSSEPGQPLRFAVDLPGDLGPPRLAGFTATLVVPDAATAAWELKSLAADGAPIDLATGPKWQTGGNQAASATTSDGDLYARYDFRLVSIGYWTQTVRLSLGRTLDSAPVPVAATPAALEALRLKQGDQTRLMLGGAEVDVRITGTVTAVPGTENAAALIADLPSLAAALFHGKGVVRTQQEWWLATRPGEHAAATAAAAELSGLTAIDRLALADEAGRDPYGVGARAALFATALGAILLAGVGVGVDVRATARRRVNELAVLHTLGAGPRLLARSLIAEQGFLAGLGVLVGVLVGIGVAATMAPLVILTPSAARPVPAPLLEVAWLPVVATAAGLLLLALALSGLIATTMRQRLAAAQLRIGADT